ncbi:lasso peptide biosynthesis B2 protein [Chitinophaga rhizophila]|uniref:Lasso peptide biosynthesis B2 protein n=1 Tax=Chitinophaga rhizophila TaxID=2866212 RepID=A0ABS7GL27_9BACT|nr:lasso peptide biosynthesis B2 protein [Chitinophaga rhizophila]MBW8687419.1 lasso peptide biosynthesis B2 protein [Chitinophaga rhizophila]
MKKFVRASCLFAEAWCCLGVARVMLICMPFRKIAPFLGENISSSPPAPLRTTARSQRIRAAISRAAACAPWRTRCFEQALAGKFMLRYRRMSGIVFFGVNKTGDAIKAHAWLESEGIIITGGNGTEQYKVIARFKN